MNILKRFELVELPIPALSTGTIFKFPDIPILRDDSTQDIVIRGMRAYSIEALPLTPSGNITASTAQLQNLYLVLYVKNEESIHYIPMIELNNIFQASAAGTSQQTFETLQLEDLKVDWNKSFLQAGAPPGNATAFSILLGVRYKKYKPGWWNKITENSPEL